MTNHKKYGEIFEYLSADEKSDRETGLAIFGRKDLLVARKALEIVQRTPTPWAIVTGGIGKDSGDLQIPEAAYLAHHPHTESDERNIALPPLYLDIQATNGGENARNSLAIIEQENLPHDNGVTAVAHATSSRRLSEMLKHAASRQNKSLRVYREATNYPFDPTNPTDQKEARGELLRLADWPAKDWLLPQEDLPENLVDFVRDVDSHAN